MSTLLDRIKGKRQEITESRAARTRTYKFKQGKTVLSLLPLHEDISKPIADQSFYREGGQHYVKDKSGKTVVVVGDRSLSDKGEVCPVREGLVDVLRHANSFGDKALADFTKESLAKPTYFINALIHQDPDMKKEEAPVLLGLSENQFAEFGSILEEYLAASADDLLRFNDRLMFVVERTGSTKNDTRYTWIPAAKRMTVDPAVMSKAVNLGEYINGQYGDLPKALSYISTVLGRPVDGSHFAAALTGGASVGSLAAPVNAIADLTAASTETEDLLAGAPSPLRTAAAPALASSHTADATFTSAPAATVTTDPAGIDLLNEIDNLAV